MKKMFLCIFTVVFFSFAHAQNFEFDFDFTFGPDFHSALKQVPIMGESTFENQKRELKDSSCLWAFVACDQRYKFFSKFGTTVCNFFALADGTGFGISKTENGVLVFSRFYDDGGNQQDGGFSVESDYPPARGLLCSWFQFMCP